jgi:hypothetical protein
MIDQANPQPTDSRNYCSVCVIVGGVAGGASCAARLRRLDETVEILMIDRGPYVSFANSGLPYYVGNVISDERRLLFASREMFHERFNIDVQIISNPSTPERVRNSQSSSHRLFARTGLRSSGLDTDMASICLIVQNSEHFENF